MKNPLGLGPSVYSNPFKQKNRLTASQFFIKYFPLELNAMRKPLTPAGAVTSLFFILSMSATLGTSRSTPPCSSGASIHPRINSKTRLTPSPTTRRVAALVTGADDGQLLEKFNLEMDWNPSSCFGDDMCDSSKITNAFTVSEMTASLIDPSKNNSRCWDKSSDQAKKLVVSDEVSKGTKKALECMFEAAAGSNEDLWRDVYVGEGSCSGMSPSQYFDTITRLYMSVGANQIASDFGVLSHSGTGNETEISVDRDSFLDYVTARVGRKAWIGCDPDTRILLNVQVCINPNDPYLIQDCTMDRNDPASTNGIPCRGELRLPIQPGGNISDKCSAYLLSEPKPATDGSSSQRWGRSSLVIGAFVLLMAP
jgi:ribonuclease I